MRKIVIAGVLVMALGGCLQRIEQRQAGADRCDVTANGEWTPAEGVAPLTVEAGSIGPSCTKAVATIVVRDATGVLWTAAYPTEHVMVLAGAADTGAMRTALGEWINSSNSTIATSSALPEWPQGSDGPVNGEFPFYAAEEMDRTTYLALRERNVPVFCYVQGMESLNCLALENGLLTEVGVQTFPG